MLWEQLKFVAILVIKLSTIIEADRLSIGEVNKIHCDCGLKNPGLAHEEREKEYSGDHVWPWMVSIVNVSINEEPVAYCGASLINDRYVLTAAHCIPDMNDTGIENFRIYLGTNFINASDNFLELGISKIITHPKFDFETADYDVSLIKLTEVVKFTKSIRPVCLKQNGSPHVGRMGIITGWGSFNLTEPTDSVLKESDVQVVSNEICKKNYSSTDIIVTETMLCASSAFLLGHDPCKADSGGPLVIIDPSSRNKYSQIGIISHGQGCTVQDFPAIFSRVEVFTDWIVENTRDARYCRGSF